MKLGECKVGMLVHDSWWPWMVGKIIKVTKSSVWVKRSGLEYNRYDKAHIQFLRKGR